MRLCEWIDVDFVLGASAVGSVRGAGVLETYGRAEGRGSRARAQHRCNYFLTVALELAAGFDFAAARDGSRSNTTTSARMPLPGLKSLGRDPFSPPLQTVNRSPLSE